MKQQTKESEERNETGQLMGKGCKKGEDIIDELLVGVASKPSRFILTSSYPDESLADVVEFAEYVSDNYPGKVQIV